MASTFKAFRLIFTCDCPCNPDNNPTFPTTFWFCICSPFPWIPLLALCCWPWPHCHWFCWTCCVDTGKAKPPTPPVAPPIPLAVGLVAVAVEVLADGCALDKTAVALDETAVVLVLAWLPWLPSDVSATPSNACTVMSATTLLLLLSELLVLAVNSRIAAAWARVWRTACGCVPRALRFVPRRRPIFIVSPGCISEVEILSLF